LNVLYGHKLDVYDKGFVGSQILGHLLYKYLSAGKTVTPMLTDTVGTRSFLETAIQLKDEGKAALCSFVSARQDSGKLAEYDKIMKYYVIKASCEKPPGLMASEIDERDEDFVLAMDLGYTLAGVGGALGDSEKIDTELVLGNKFDKKVHFAASEAAKITRVWSGNGISGYTLKTGDNAGTDKVTYDKKADSAVVKELKQRADNFQRLHQDALRELNSGNGEITLLPLENLANKQQILDEELQRIISKNGFQYDSGVTLPGTTARVLPGESVYLDEGNGQGPEVALMGGRRRTRRKVRKVTKKYVRKNIRKSKHMRNRRSNRRKSRK